MSKIIRQSIPAPAVYIGEKHLDLDKESNAEKRLGNLFPVVSVITDPDGARLIPIQEVYKIEQLLNEQLDNAQEQGYKRGYEAGLQQGLDEAAKVLQQLDQAIKNAVTQREALFEEARERILDLIITISRKVTFDAVEADPEVTLKMIDGVIDSLTDRSKLKIKVNPQHLPIIEQNVDRFLKGSTTIKELSVEADPRVQYGGCFIETPTGDIDARLDSQFEVIRDVLRSDDKVET